MFGLEDANIRLDDRNQFFEHAIDSAIESRCDPISLALKALFVRHERAPESSPLSAIRSA